MVVVDMFLVFVVGFDGDCLVIGVCVYLFDVDGVVIGVDVLE